MLQSDPKKRPTMSDLYCNSWLWSDCVMIRTMSFAMDDELDTAPDSATLTHTYSTIDGLPEGELLGTLISLKGDPDEVKVSKEGKKGDTSRRKSSLSKKDKIGPSILTSDVDWECKNEVKLSSPISLSKSARQRRSSKYEVENESTPKSPKFEHGKLNQFKTQPPSKSIYAAGKLESSPELKSSLKKAASLAKLVDPLDSSIIGLPASPIITNLQIPNNKEENAKSPLITKPRSLTADALVL
jgi:hypothetical protein